MSPSLNPMGVTGLKGIMLQLSLGDARSYYLTTAANELGVVYAKSEAGMLYWT